MTGLEKWLSEVKERLEKATPGPWENETDWGYVMTITQGEDEPPICGDCMRVNSSLIAAAPTDLKKAVMIIESYKSFESWSVDFTVNKIAALSDEEIWKLSRAGGDSEKT